MDYTQPPLSVFTSQRLCYASCGDLNVPVYQLVFILSDFSPERYVPSGLIGGSCRKCHCWPEFAPPPLPPPFPTAHSSHCLLYATWLSFADHHSLCSVLHVVIMCEWYFAFLSVFKRWKYQSFYGFFADCFHAEICAYAVFCLQFKYTCSWLLRFTDKTFNKQLHVHMLMFLYSWSYHFLLSLCFLLSTARAVTFCCLCVSCSLQLELSLSVVSVLSVLYS